jgi:hypothetical protein
MHTAKEQVFVYDASITRSGPNALIFSRTITRVAFIRSCAKGNLIRPPNWDSTRPATLLHDSNFVPPHFFHHQTIRVCSSGEFEAGYFQCHPATRGHTGCCVGFSNVASNQTLSKYRFVSVERLKTPTNSTPWRHATVRTAEIHNFNLASLFQVHRRWIRTLLPHSI